MRILCAQALLAAAAVSLAACASRPAARTPAPEASVRAGAAVFRSPREIELPFVVAVANPRATSIRIESAECTLEVQGLASPLEASCLRGATVEGGGSVESPIVFEVDARGLDGRVGGAGGPASAACRLQAAVSLVAPDGGRLVAAAEAECSFPIVREPLFRITSIRIERDLLVVTSLRLGLEIENPNAFPVELRALSYGFYGEGKLWADGGSEAPFAVPAGEMRELGLRFEMNFANVDRRLFDLVANLGTVRYRLTGAASVATGEGFLPAFETRFEREGSCLVER